MKVLVTGAGGFVGSHVVESLLEKTDAEIVCVVSFRHNGSAERMSHDRRVQVIVHDLNAPLSLYHMRALSDVTHVINVGSRCQVDQSIKEPADFILNNVNLMINVLEFCRRQDITKLIHMSTDEVHGSFGYRGHNPSNPYSASKAAQEDIAIAYHKTYDLPLSIIRSANMFGERQSLLAFIPKLMSWVLNGDVVPIHAVNGIPGSRYYTYVKNVTDSIVDHLEYTAFADYGLSGQQELSNLELAHQVADLMGYDLKFELIEAHGVRPGYDEAYGKLQGTWKPTITFDKGLARTVQWAMDNKDWLR